MTEPTIRSLGFKDGVEWLGLYAEDLSALLPSPTSIPDLPLLQRITATHGFHLARWGSDSTTGRYWLQGPRLPPDPPKSA